LAFEKGVLAFENVLVPTSKTIANSPNSKLFGREKIMHHILGKHIS
jgi:hypothetical protein